jgi:hypothetical protein
MFLISNQPYLCHFFQKEGASSLRDPACLKDSYQYPALPMIQLIFHNRDSLEPISQTPELFVKMLSSKTVL